MLILTRKVGESVMIGQEIKVTVLNTKGNQVRLGVDAPSTVSVHREEIFTRIQQVQESVSNSKILEETILQALASKKE